MKQTKKDIIKALAINKSDVGSAEIQIGLLSNKIEILANKKIIKANADECKEITGFSIGGVSPFAHTNPPDRIFIDENLNRFEIVFAAAGHPNCVFKITYNQLIKITNGFEKDISE